MRYAVVDHGPYAWIAVYHLLGRGRGRIAEKCGAHIGHEHPPQLGKRRHELHGTLAGVGSDGVNIGGRAAISHGAESGSDLVDKNLIEFLDPESGMIPHIVAAHIALAKKSREI